MKLGKRLHMAADGKDRVSSDLSVRRDERSNPRMGKERIAVTNL